MPQATRSAASFIPACFFIAVFIFFFVVVASTMANWQKVELTHLDLLRPETFRYICEAPDKNRLKLYQVYFEHAARYKGESMPELYSLLAFCYYKQGKVVEAQKTYEKALKIDPSFFWNYYNLGLIYFKQGHSQEALELFKKANELDLRLSISHLLLSVNVFLPIFRDCGMPSPKNLWQHMQEAQLRLTIPNINTLDLELF